MYPNRMSICIRSNATSTQGPGDGGDDYPADGAFCTILPHPVDYQSVIPGR